MTDLFGNAITDGASKPLPARPAPSCNTTPPLQPTALIIRPCTIIKDPATRDLTWILHED